MLGKEKSPINTAIFIELESLKSLGKVILNNSQLKTTTKNFKFEFKNFRRFLFILCYI